MHGASDQRPTRALGYVFALVVATGCYSDRTVGGGESGESGGGPSGTTTSGAPSPGTTSTGTAEDTTSTGSTGVGFAGAPDFGDGLACDVFLQNCPVDLKCTMDYFDAAHPFCTPVVEEPRHEGEPCHVEGTHHSGIDDCEVGALCWGATDESLMGICRAFCGGGQGEEEYLCEDPSTACAVSGGIELALCVPVCDPLRPNCLEGELCVAINDIWSCAPDASGDAGIPGDPCEFLNACDPGLVCLDATTTQPPGLPCEGAAGCCTEACDLQDPAGAQQCAAQALGAQCVPFPWQDEAAPPGYEHVGVCALPR